MLLNWVVSGEESDFHHQNGNVSWVFITAQQPMMLKYVEIMLIYCENKVEDNHGPTMSQWRFTIPIHSMFHRQGVPDGILCKARLPSEYSYLIGLFASI